MQKLLLVLQGDASNRYKDEDKDFHDEARLNKEYLEKGWKVVSITDAIASGGSEDSSSFHNRACWVVVEKNQ
jgi:hypothetical protein